MYNEGILRWGNRLLKIFVILLLLLGLVFVLKFIFSNSSPDLEKHRPQLKLLEKVYKLKKKRLADEYDRKIETSPNEVLSVKYQQEKGLSLDETEDLYFESKRVILEGDYGVLERFWREEIKEIKGMGVKEDEKRPTPG